MTAHRVEVHPDGFDEWAWGCLTPGCFEEATGYETFDAADAAADEHRRSGESSRDEVDQ